MSKGEWMWKKYPWIVKSVAIEIIMYPKKKVQQYDWPLRNTVQDAMLIQYIKNQNKQYVACDKDIVKRFGGFISG